MRSILSCSRRACPTSSRWLPSAREATFSFRSDLAHVNLKLSASTDRDVRKVILSYDLQIIPVLMRYKSHDEIEFPLDAVDKEAVAKWMDDRLVEFVRTYFSMGENEIYLKAHMVEDPIARLRVEHAGNDRSFLKVELREGRNREIRRVFAKLGFPVLELKRIRIGELTLHGLRPGDWRFLQKDEVQALLQLSRADAGRADASSRRAGGDS